MCGRHWSPNSQPEPALDNSLTPSPYDEEINKFFDRVSGFTKKVVGQTYNMAKSHEFPNWEEESMRFSSRPYQTRDRDLDGERPMSVPFGVPFGIFNVFGGASGATPFGIYSYRSPSTREYNDCLKKDGESVWDSEGYWRCLFPNREVPNRILDYKKSQLAGHILTKEDFHEALEENQNTVKDGVIDLGAQGTYFTQFNDFLNWKNTMYENVRKQRAATRKRIRDSLEAPEAPKEDKSVISTSVQTTMNSDDKEVVMKERRTEVFNDGTSITKHIVRTKPFGASDWATVSEELNDDKDGKSGWFWNK